MNVPLPGFMLLVRGVGMCVARVQFRDHVNEGHIHEDASSGHEDQRGQVLQVAQQHPNHHPDEG